MTDHTETLRDLHLSGIGTASGGVYGTVRISGVGTVNGDIETQQLTVSGAGTIRGSVAAQEARLSGSANITGDLVANQLGVSGSATIGGRARSTRACLSGSTKTQQNLEADELEVSGAVHVRGSVVGTAFRGSGAFNVRHDVKAREFKSSGAFDIGGRLAADLIEIRPNGRCTVNTLIGKTVSVIDDPHRRRNDHQRRRLTADSIAAPEISLELTTAETVCGRVVRIGPGCRIGTVECSESLDVDPNATVRHTKYTGTGEEHNESQ